MTTTKQYRKRCYSCSRLVDVSYQEFLNGQEHTTCEICKGRLAATANEAGKPKPDANPIIPPV